jgi:mono/diheme cytochrome c family protein
MKSYKKVYLSLTAVAILCTLLLAFTYTPQVQKSPQWDVPAKFKNLKNPVKNADQNKAGMELWSQHCKSCHGVKGLGDGTKARGLTTTVPSLSTEKFQSQTDGEIFYKFVYGRDEMPSFEKKINDDEDRWAIVNYMRTFKK